MIIFFGGLIGAGKSTIARRIADHFSYLYYDIDEIKKEVYPNDPDFERNLAEGIMFSDQTRQLVFERVIADLERLVQEHPHIVVDETLHKKNMRHLLYDAALRIAGDFIIVWVRASESVIIERLTAKRRREHLLADPLPLHEAIVRDFEEFNRSVIVCSNNGTVDETVADLVHLLKSVAGLVTGE